MDVALLVCAGIALVAGLAALLLAARTRAAARRDLEAARTEGAELRRRLDELERTRTARPAEPVVTPSVPVGRRDDRDDEVDPVEAVAVEGRVLPAPVFTDMVVRESVIRLASLTHGVRRALNAETRNRVRFEMRREVRRSRKQRRTDMRAALRRMQAEEREAA